MGFIIVGIALLLIGLVVFYFSCETGVFIMSISAALLSISLIMVPITIMAGKNTCNDYLIKKAVFESYATNEQISSMERVNAIELATEMNIEINRNKTWRKNFWIGLFYYHPIGDLEKFDISKLPVVK